VHTNLIFGGFAFALSVVLLLSCQVGFFIGRRAVSRPDHAFDHAMSWQGAVMGLAALLIGFTFAMAVQRFDARKQVLMSEANAIGTTYLRTHMLDEPSGRELRQLLRGYVDLRIALYDANINGAQNEAISRAAGQLRQQIWARVSAAGRADPHSVTTGLLVASTNEMFDHADERQGISDTPIPVTVFVVVILVSAIAMASIGYACGFDRRRMSFGMFVLPLLVTGVIMLVFDLAHPSLGIVRVPDVAMIRLRQGL
jgi:hypothetical protein